MPPPGYTGRRAALSNSYEPLNRRTPQQRDCSRLSPERRAFPFGGCPRLSRRARRAFRMDICPSALTRRCVFASLYARELWAGAMLCLAGFSSGRSLGARGGLFCAAMRLCRGALWSIHVCYAFLLECFVFDHACCLPRERQTGRLAECCVPVPPWVVIAGRAFSGCRAVIGLGWFTSGLCVSLWRSRRRTEETERTRRRRGDEGTESAALCECVFAQAHWLCHVFRGEFVGGCAPPNLRQRAIGSLDSLHLIRNVGAIHAARASRVQRRLERLQ